MTPYQSPQQKQLKMADLDAQPVLMTAPSRPLSGHHVSSQVIQAQIEIDLRRYDHYKDNLKVLGNNAEEILLQVITTCMWAGEYHEKTGQTPDPYLFYMFWAQSLWYDDWDVLTIDDLTTTEYRDKCKERWKYLITLLRFWMDNNPIYVCVGKTSERHGKLCLTTLIPISWKEHHPTYAMVPISRLSSATVHHYEPS